MKKLLFCTSQVMLGLLILSSCDKKLDTDQRRGTYAVGIQIANNLKNQRMDYDPDVLAMALKDVSKGKEIRLSQQEMQQALMTFQNDLNKKSQEAAAANLEKSHEFLTKNRSETGIMTTKSGVQYLELQKGTGASPKATDLIKVNYRGTLLDGSQFESSYEGGQPVQLQVNTVFPGWSEGLQTMQVGGKTKFFIPPELAYGPNDRPGIPGNSVLILEVELLDILPPKKAK
jgi:FKBP-type peptidyl-prolyl cis-trans isomerase